MRILPVALDVVDIASDTPWFSRSRGLQTAKSTAQGGHNRPLINGKIKDGSKLGLRDVFFHLLKIGNHFLIRPGCGSPLPGQKFGRKFEQLRIIRREHTESLVQPFPRYRQPLGLIKARQRR